MKKINLFLVIAGISFIASLFVILQLPDTVPIHWNAAGKIDGYGSKWIDLFLSAMPFIIYFLMGVTKQIDPKQDKIKKRDDVYEMFRWLLGGIFIVINWIVLYVTTHEETNATLFVFLAMGMMLIIVGNYMPRIPQNYFLGFRVPWAIENERVWYHTQRIGGYVMVISGILIIIAGFIGNNTAVAICVGILFVGICLAILDSYIFYKKLMKNKK